MFVGDTEDGSGVLHMVLEVLANSYDQHLAGRCSQVSIEIAADGTITVTDNGPGLAADGGDGLPPLHEMLTCLSDRATVDGHRPHVHLGLGGLGLFVVNALSERFELRSVRQGTLTTAVYSRGEAIEPPASSPAGESSGTRILFRPDSTIFRYPRLPRAELARQLEDLSFLAPRFAVRLTIAGDDVAAGGLASRVALAASCALEDVAAHAATYSTPSGPIDVEVALTWRVSRWTVARGAAIESWANLSRTLDHGSHVDGLLEGARSFMGGRKESRLAGLIAAVSVILSDVKFGNPNKSRLETTDVGPPVTAATTSALEAWSQSRPELFASIHRRVRGE